MPAHHGPALLHSFRDRHIPVIPEDEEGHRVSQRRDQSGDEKQERPQRNDEQDQDPGHQDPEIIARQSERGEHVAHSDDAPRTHIQEEPLTSREQHRHSERSDTVSEALRERMQPDAAS